MANAGFILIVGAIVAWLWGTGKLQSMLNIIRGSVNVDTNRSGPLYGGQGLLFG